MAAVGADNIAVEQLPADDPDNWMTVHTYLLAEAGVPMIEVMDLEVLAAEQLWTHAFIGACMRIRGATAGPAPMAYPFIAATTGLSTDSSASGTRWMCSVLATIFTLEQRGRLQAFAQPASVGAFFHRRRGLALGTVGVAFGLGVILGPLLGVRLATTAGNWRAPFLAFGVAGLLVALIGVVAVSRRITERGLEGLPIAGCYDHVPDHPYNRNSVALAAASALGGIVVYGFLGLCPTFLVNELHVTTTQSALALSFVGFGGLTGLIGGWLGDLVDQRRLLIGSFVAMAIIGVLIYIVQATIGWQYLFAFLMGVFGTGILFPNANSAIQRAVRPDQVGRAAGLFVTSYYGAAALSGLLFAALVGALGWRGAGLIQVTLLSLIGVGALVFVRTSRLSNAA